MPQGAGILRHAGERADLSFIRVGEPDDGDAGVRHRVRQAPSASAQALQERWKRPNNTSGGHLCEGYTHGMNMVIENVRQLRHDVDDYCPIGPDGKRQHTYDYQEGGCRQVRNIEVTANLGWANPSTASSMVMRRG